MNRKRKKTRKKIWTKSLICFILFERTEYEYTLCEELIFKLVLGAELYQLLGDFHWEICKWEELWLFAN